VYAWRDVMPPEFAATREEKLEATVMRVLVRFTRPPIEVGTLPFRSWHRGMGDRFDRDRGGLLSGLRGARRRTGLRI
jgi:hypothetical protein